MTLNKGCYIKKKKRLKGGVFNFSKGGKNMEEIILTKEMEQELSNGKGDVENE